MLFMKTSDGLHLQYKEHGRGPAVLFCHEFGGNYSSWDRQVERLSVAHRCIVYTARGFSPSAIPDRATHYGLRLLVRDLVELVEHLELDRFHLVGASMGAVTALLAAEHLVEELKTLTLVGCLGGPLSRLALYEHRSGIRDALLGLEEGRPASIFSQQAHYRRLSQDKRVLWPKYQKIIDQHDVAGLRRSLELVEWYPPDLQRLAGRLKVITAPTLLICGDEDSSSVRSTNDFLAKVLPAARNVVFTHCGKLAHFEQSEAFNKHLWQHIRNVELRENGKRHYSTLELSSNIVEA